jgi:UDP-glucose 4-epimerase
VARGAGIVIVVTGGSGHLGQWVISALTAAGHDVAVLSRSPLEHPTIAGVAWSRPVSAVACDLGDRQAVVAAAPILRRAEAVVHLAAHVPEATARNADGDADATLRANVHGTIALLTALHESYALRSLVYASTFEVYGEPRTVPMTEEHPTEPLGYYGASKLAGEKHALVAAGAGSFACTVLRLPAVYGPGDTLRRAVGNFVRAAAASRPLEIRGDGADRRDLVYVADAAEAVVCALERRPHGVYNVADGRGISVRELAETVASVAGGATIVELPREKPRRDYVLDVASARRDLGWTSRTALADGIRAQLAWTREAT